MSFWIQWLESAMKMYIIIIIIIIIKLDNLANI